MLTACASHPPTSPEAVPDTVATAPEPTAKAPPERQIPADSLYPLLLAEFALRRQDYETALRQYQALAPTLGDAGVAAHTTKLAQFLRRDEIALEAAQLWVQLEPDTVDGNNMAAILLSRHGRTLEALPHLASVQRLGGDANFPMLLKDVDDLLPRQRQQLQQGIAELAAEFPNNSLLLLTEAMLLAKQKKSKRALTKLEDVFALDSDLLPALLLEASIRADNQMRNPFARIEKVLQNKPDDQELRRRYARLLARTDIDSARKQFEILSDQSPSDGNLLYSLALIQRELGDNEAAQSYLQQMVKLKQRQNEAHALLGRIAEDAGDTDTALQHYQKVQNGPEYLAATDRVGRLILDAGSLEDMQDWFALQRQSVPERMEQLYSLEADILATNGYQSQAIKLLGVALQEFPDDARLRYARSMLREQGGDIAGMEADLRVILGGDPDNTTALNALGYTLANHTQRLAEAETLIAKALELEPNEPAILDSMGWLLFRQGRYAEALTYLERAYAEFPDAEVAAHLGEVLWATGDTKRALSIWRGAALDNPEHPVLRETLQRIGVENQVRGNPLDSEEAPVTTEDNKKSDAR